MMDAKRLYKDLDALQGELQIELLAYAAEELEQLDPALRRSPDPELIQTLAAVQAVKDYLVTRKKF